MKIAAKYVRALLASKSGITAIVSTRIYSGALPKGYTLPAITFWPDGTGDSVVEQDGIQERGFAVRCWAVSELGAYDLYATVCDALFASNTHSVTVGATTDTLTVWRNGAETPLEDSDTGEHSVVVSIGVGLST